VASVTTPFAPQDGWPSLAGTPKPPPARAGTRFILRWHPTSLVLEPFLGDKHYGTEEFLADKRLGVRSGLDTVLQERVNSELEV
jgi:hypothetical protein